MSNGAQQPSGRWRPAPAFQELLDHLGRLLAREYVALLTKSKINQKAEGPEERTQS
jgi:hypothetical protein